MKKKRVFFRVLIIAVVLIITRYSIHSDGPHKGKVVELETGRPIEGVVVAASWDIETWINTWKFCDARETLTNKNGEFELPKGWCIAQPFARINWATVVVFKPGYLGYPPISNTYEASLFTGFEFRDKKRYETIWLGKPKTTKDRQLTLAHAEIFLSGDESIRKLPILFRMTNQESKDLGLGQRTLPAK